MCKLKHFDFSQRMDFISQGILKSFFINPILRWKKQVNLCNPQFSPSSGLSQRVLGAKGRRWEQLPGQSEVD